MRLILNGVNGRYLRDLVENARGKTDRVDAAVAYATDERLLFDVCWEAKIPLRFWGRFDAGVPVSIPILEKFLKRGSAHYVCRLVRCFHPKVIWWRGYGAYIGSANLSGAAWYNNVEAGVFLTDDELTASSQAEELETLFLTLDRESSPLTDELFDLLRRREAEIRKQKNEDHNAAKQHLETHLVKPWEGLAHASSKKAGDRRRVEFLEEWKSTLQIIRDLSGVISRPEYRPDWVSADAPLGAQADQFLHAHYYQRTFDGRRADFETHFERQKSDPDAAVRSAAQWWKSLTFAPSSEDVMLNETAPRLRATLTQDGLAEMTQEGFIEVLTNVHASKEFARRVPNDAVGLPGGRTYLIPEKLEAMGHHIWRVSGEMGKPVAKMLDWVLYGGSSADLPERMFEALYGGRWNVPHIGVSTLGEIVGWAQPDLFPPRNGRTSKALRSLGYPVRVHVGG